MFAQFQSLYPNSSIISELVQIFQGKYIVRASVQIEGITRATGMAASETIEAAEDQARNRALMVLGIVNASGEAVALSPKAISPAQINPSSTTTSGFSESTYAAVKDEWSMVGSKEMSSPTLTTDSRSVNKSDTSHPDFSQRFPAKSNWENQYDTPVENVGVYSAQEMETQPLAGISLSNVTPFTPRSYTAQEELGTESGAGKRKKKTEPVNLSDVIAKTDVQIERLRWTKEQGREYLKQTYGKIGRSLLSEEELLDFLKYLESQPDPIAGF